MIPGIVTIMSKCRQALPVAILVIALVSMRAPASRNVGYLFISRAMCKACPTGQLQRAITWLRRSLPGNHLARTHYTLGRAYRLLGNSAEAVRAFQQAVNVGCSELECHLGLIDMLMEQGATQEAVVRMLDLLELAPLDSKVSTRAQTLLSATRTTFVFPEGELSAEWPIQLNPSEWHVLEAELLDTRPRWISVVCSGEGSISLSSRTGATPGSELLSARCGSLVRILVGTPQSSGTIRFKVGNTGATPVTIESAFLEYVTNVERFSDIGTASWTQVPHKAIGPLGTYNTCLYLDTHQSRELAVTYYDYPARDLEVLIEGNTVGVIVGGVRTSERIGGFTPFSFVVPPEAPRLLRVTLKNPSPRYATAVSSMYIITD